MSTPTPSPAPGRGASRRGSTSLLELVPELGEDLSAGDRSAARRDAAVRTVPIERGAWLPTSLASDPSAFGVLVTEGAIVRDVLLAGSVASDLLGPGDVAALGGDEDALVPAALRWTVSAPGRVAVLDGQLLASLEAWPTVVARLLAHATRQTSTMAILRAISQLPRVDQRLLALFWHLAERWGRVGPHGIVVRLALTHETLGRMVGARRPTVSLALKELATAGAVVRRADGSWILRQDGLLRLEPDGTWQPPDATVLPELERAARHPAKAVQPFRAAADELQGRLHALDASYTEQQRRVREVLDRCAATREELIQARQRRAAGRPPDWPPPPR